LFGVYGLALAALALVLFGAYDSCPVLTLQRFSDLPVLDGWLSVARFRNFVNFNRV